MSLSNSELERLRAKLNNSPPYDWEDDVEALLDAVRWARAERDAYLDDYTAELDGGRELRKCLGAREGETIWGCAERVIAERDQLLAAYEEAHRVLMETYTPEEATPMHEHLLPLLRAAIEKARGGG